MEYISLSSPDALHTGYQQQVKEANIKRMFDLIRSEKCTSRVELVRAMNLSATSVSGLVEELTARGLVDEIGPQQTSLPGRRPISLRFNGDAAQMAVFTISHEGVEYTLLNLNCKVLERIYEPFPLTNESRGDQGERYAALIEETLTHRATLYDPARALMVGVSLPAVYSKARRLFYLESIHAEITETTMLQLQQRLGKPMLFGNSSMCMAYAEKKSIDAGHAGEPEVADLIYLHIRDHVSGTVISNGTMNNGPYNTAGQFGHISIDHRGKPCICGSVGCLEQYVNTKAILEQVQSACRAAGAEIPRSLDELAGRYPADPPVESALNEISRMLAFGIYAAICCSGIQRVVLGGRIGALGDGFLRRLYRDIFSRQPLTAHLNLSYAQAGPDAEPIGMARYYLDKIYTVTM